MPEALEVGAGIFIRFLSGLLGSHCCPLEEGHLIVGSVAAALLPLAVELYA